jgi:antitoxin component YwqK of YwqJK toxin-antitoxin module
MKKLIYLLCLWVTWQAQAQDTTFTTKAKPKTDTSARRDGILTKFLKDNSLKKIKDDVVKQVKDTKELVDKNKKELDRLQSDAADLGLRAKKTNRDGRKEKKRVNRNEYEGLRMERVVSSFGSGNNTTVEEFHVISDDELEAQPYAPEIRWYDYKQRRTVTTVIKDKSYSQILHGPYKRYVGDDLVEEGYFYLGAKNGRWERYGKEFDQDFVLLDKQYFWRGFAAESQVSYYGKDSVKIKEVVPLAYGKQTGQYVSFYENGQKQTEGRYDDGTRIGVWREYHSTGKARRVIQYPKDKFDAETSSHVAEEYDDKGKQTFKGQKPLGER